MRPLWLAAAAVAAVWLALRAHRRRVTRLELAVVPVGIGVLAAAGAGILPLPDLEGLFRRAGEVLGPWTYALAALLAFLETGAFVGLLVPGETVLIVAGMIAGQGRISIVGLIAITWAAAVAGDVTSLLLGRRFGRELMLRHGPRVRLTAERFERVERFYERHGGKAVLLGRFVGLVRAVSPFVAGSSRMALKRFLPFDVAGAGLWVTALAMLGFVFWESFERASAVARDGALAIGAVIVVGAALAVALRTPWARARRERARSWLRARRPTSVRRPAAPADARSPER